MVMAAILLNDAQPFEQIDNTPLTVLLPPPPPPPTYTHTPLWNLVKIAQVVSEKKTFKNIAKQIVSKAHIPPSNSYQRYVEP